MFTGIAAAGAVLCAFAPVAIADTTAPTVTSVGTSRIKPTPVDNNSDASIRKAVEEAEDKALPRAIAEARSYATKLATASGLRLGPLQSISNTPGGGFFFGYGPQGGTFPDGHFCGQVPKVKFVVANGRRTRKVLGKHRVCRVPSSVSVTVSVTYAIAP